MQCHLTIDGFRIGFWQLGEDGWVWKGSSPGEIIDSHRSIVHERRRSAALLRLGLPTDYDDPELTPEQNEIVREIVSSLGE